jgi:DNA-binding FadR family transcriptional regulator
VTSSNVTSASVTTGPTFAKVAERAPLSVLVSRQLREAIVSGKLASGTEMPSEKDLGRDLGVSRATVREALRILQAQGLLTGGGTVSTQRPRVSAEETVPTAAQALENMLLLGQIPLSDLVEFRALIEGEVVTLAAERRDRGALAQAEEALAAMRAVPLGVEAFRAADVAFHRALAAASGNLAYPLVMGVLRGTIAQHLGDRLRTLADPRRAMTTLTREHEAIFAAVAAGQGSEARGLVTRHIQAFYAASARKRRAP